MPEKQRLEDKLERFPLGVNDVLNKIAAKDNARIIKAIKVTQRLLGTRVTSFSLCKLCERSFVDLLGHLAMHKFLEKFCTCSWSSWVRDTPLKQCLKCGVLYLESRNSKEETTVIGIYARVVAGIVKTIGVEHPDNKTLDVSLCDVKLN